MVSFKIFKQSKENNPGSFKYASYLLLQTKNFRRKTGKEKFLLGKQILKEKEALTASGLGVPAPGRKGGGGSQGNFNVTWSRATNLRQSVHARSPPRRLAPRTVSQASPGTALDK